MRAPHFLLFALCGFAGGMPVAAAWPTPSQAPGTAGAPPPAISDCEDLAAVPIHHNVPYEAVQDAWLFGGCVGCHNTGAAMGSLILDSAARSAIYLVGQPSFRNPVVMRVEPGDPEASLAYSMLNCTPPPTYDPMPPSMSGTRIDIVLRARVYDWIAQGARATDEDGNPLSDFLFRDGIEGTRFQRALAPPPTAHAPRGLHPAELNRWTPGR